MYKKTHNTLQGRADKTRVLSLESGDDNLTDDERYNILRERSQKLQLQLHDYSRKSPERKQIGLSIAKINFEINQLRGRKKSAPGLGAIFMDVCFRQLPKEQYTALVEEAQYIHDLRYKMDRKRSAAKYAEELGRAIDKQQSTRDRATDE